MFASTMQRWFIGLLVFAAMSLDWHHATAQPRRQDPHVAYAFPAGCQQGMSSVVVLGGQYLNEATEAHVTGKGVQVEVIKWYRPLTRGEYNQLRMALNDARTKLLEQRTAKGVRGRPSVKELAIAAGITDEQLAEMEIYQQRERDPKRQPNEQLLEEVTLKLTVAEDAEPGKRELRMLTDTAMSNPIWIHVGKWPEVRETEPNDVTPDPVIDQLPTVVNGQIMPGDTDTFSFSARKGMRLVINAAARDVIPYLADAVPGWFQAVMTLSDSAGNELAYADSFHYRQDPVIYFEVPRDGRYTIQIRDSLYRGREDFVYRITLGELPFITSIFPLGARIDSKVSVELQGWNLSQSTLDVEPTSHRFYRPVRWLSAPQQDGTSIRFPFKIDRMSEVLDQEPNNDRTTSQEIQTRMIVNGRIDQPGDRDVFRIKGFGQLVAEVHARRHGSPLDSVLTLTDASGREIAYNDDYEDKTLALSTHHADSHLSAVLPRSGTYFLHLTDAQHQGGMDFVYRLYVRAPQPDYELRVTPSSIIARAGALVPITVFAFRKDGFAEDIHLTLVEPPPEFRLDGAVIPGNSDRVQMTLAVPKTGTEGPIALEMIGNARRDRRTRSVLTRPAVPAENMMQAFIWHHLVPVEEWNVVVSDRRSARPPFEVIVPRPHVRLPRKGEIVLNVRPLNKNIKADELRVGLHEAPQGVSAEIVTGDDSGKFAVKLSTSPDETEPGLRGNLLLYAYRETTVAPTEANPNPRTRRTDYGFLPAIPFEISGRKSRR